MTTFHISNLIFGRNERTFVFVAAISLLLTWIYVYHLRTNTIPSPQTRLDGIDIELAPKMAQKVDTDMLRAKRLFSVEGWVCLVTGGGTGIGLMCAQALAANGEFLPTPVYLVAVMPANYLPGVSRMPTGVASGVHTAC